MLKLSLLAKDSRYGARLIASLSRIYMTTLTVFVFAMALQAQTDQVLEMQTGSIVGTVIDVNGDAVAGANVVLEGSDNNDHRATTNENGFFEFQDLEPRIPYHVTVTAQGFTSWASPLVTIEPQQYKILSNIQLRVAVVRTTVDVTQTAEEIATEQVKTEEKQRIFGIIPNFYIVYEPNPVPLTTKLKFRLALSGNRSDYVYRNRNAFRGPASR